MQKILIVEDNILQSKQIINHISRNNEDVKLYNMAYTCREALDIIKTEIVDIILLDLNLPDVPGTEIIKFIQKNNIKKYINSIIVITSENQMFSTIKDSPYIYSYIPKPYNLDNIQKQLEIIIKSKQDDIVKDKINKELKYLHYNFSYNGTRYLSETIFEIYNKEDFFIDNLKKIFIQ